LQRVQGSRFVAREGAEGRHRFGLAPLAPLALSGLSVLGALAALSLDADGRGPRRSVAGA
jgi:hypothetical protein